MSEPSKYSSVPLPRFYIAKNRTLLNEAGTDPNGALAVLYNVQIKPLSRDLYRLQATVVISEPMGETHGFDESSMDKSDEYEFCPKAWLKLRVIKVVENVNTVINADMDRSFFKKVYNTYKLSTKVPGDLKKVGDQAIAKSFAHAIINPVSATKAMHQSIEISAKNRKPVLKTNAVAPSLSISTSKAQSPNEPTPKVPISKASALPVPAHMPLKKAIGQNAIRVTTKPYETTTVNTPTQYPRSSIKGKARASASLSKVKDGPRQGSIYGNEPVSVIETPSPVMISMPKEGLSKNIIRIPPPVEKKNTEAKKDEVRPTIRLIVKNREPPKVISHDNYSEASESDSSQEKEKKISAYLVKETSAESEESPSFTDEDNSSYADAVSTSPVNETFETSSPKEDEVQLTDTNVSFERYMENTDNNAQTTAVHDTQKKYYIDASKELWKKLRDCKLFFIIFIRPG